MISFRKGQKRFSGHRDFAHENHIAVNNKRRFFISQ